MKKLILICAVLISGCSTTVPVTKPFPTAPEPLLQDCEKLETINKPTVLLSEFMKTVVTNYTKFHTCAEQVKAWKEWYTKQKHIFDEAAKPDK